MGKRGKGQNKAITKRDPEAKKQRRTERESSPPDTDEESAADGDADAGDPSDDGDANDDSASDARSAAAPVDDVAAKLADDPPEPPLRGEAWALPFARFERKWTWLETRMLMVTLGCLIATLCFWFAMRGMKDPVSAQSVTGTVWRALFGMLALGGLARFVTKKLGLEESKRTAVTIAAVLVGAFGAKAWRSVGIEYFTGILDWLQQGSSICLFGGLKGISTRLTMLVSLIGASLACSAGTHINVDLAVRLIPKRFGKHAHIVGNLGAALVCLISSWGFFDFTAVSGFKAPAEASAGEKVAHVAHHVGDHAFLLRKQLGLDFGAFPYVIKGEKWNHDSRMNGREWNRFLDEGGFVDRFGAANVADVRAADAELDAPRRPFVVLPGGSAAGALIHSLDLIFTVGFLMIGLRFLLRALLVQGGCMSHDPHAAEPQDTPDGPAPGDAAGAESLAKEAA